MLSFCLVNWTNLIFGIDVDGSVFVWSKTLQYVTCG